MKGVRGSSGVHLESITRKAIPTAKVGPTHFRRLPALSKSAHETNNLRIPPLAFTLSEQMYADISVTSADLLMRGQFPTFWFGISIVCLHLPSFLQPNPFHFNTCLIPLVHT